MPPVYVDHAATGFPTLFPACDPPGGWANPASAHSRGRDARAALDAARTQIGTALGLPPALHDEGHLVVTSGGTEGNNIVLQHPGWDFVVTAAIEHPAVQLTAQFVANYRDRDVVWLVPDRTGRVPPEAVATALAARRGRTGLVSVAYANNEVGAVQDLSAIGAVVADANRAAVRGGGGGTTKRVWLHTDAVQAPGHLPLDLGPGGALAGVDFLTLSAHKFHGPPGVGLLFCRTAGVLRSLLCGGHQQAGLRPGTEGVGPARGMAAALAAAVRRDTWADRMRAYAEMVGAIRVALHEFVVTGLVLPTGPADPRWRAPHHVSFCVRGAHRRDLVAALDALGVQASGGSACTTEERLPSHVLAALEVPPEYIHGSVRLTLGVTNTPEEIRSVVVPALRTVLGRVAEGLPPLRKEN